MRKALSQTEDWLGLLIGLLLFGLSLFTLAGLDLLGWAAATSPWLSLAKAVSPVSKAYAALPAVGSLALTYLSLLALMTAAAAVLGADVKRFAAGFSVIFWASYLCWLAGHFAYIAATPDKRAGFGIPWSIVASSRMRPPQRGQSSPSRSNTRRMSAAQAWWRGRPGPVAGMGCGAPSGGGSLPAAGSAPESPSCPQRRPAVSPATATGARP
jgi:hypothetical protein